MCFVIHALCTTATESMKYRLSLILSVLMFILLIDGQSQFIDISHALDSLGVNISTPQHVNGSGVSFYDFNNDGWDDISIAGGASHPVFLVNNEGVFENAPFQIPNSGNGNIYSLLWVDFDNDGDADLFISKDPGGIELWENDGNMSFTNISEQVGFSQQPFKHSNAAFADFDHDGFLDLFVCKYYSHIGYPDSVYAGKLYQNNGGEYFNDVTAESGVYTPAHTALQPIFADFNNDGWEDLFIAVDRIPYHNELFLNNQNGTFTRISGNSGINNFIDAMSATAGDFDRNGYLDIYVTNNPIVTGNSLFRNNSNSTFTDMAVLLGVEVMESCWGATWIDYNNNGWEDLFVSTISEPTPIGNRLFVNSSGIEFTDHADFLGLNNVNTATFTCATGDINNDGYFDLVNNNRFPFTPRLFLNSGGSNNYLSLTLEGTLANKEGIGTWIHCYAGGEHQVRYTQCGENLAGQNSRKEIFGLGQNNTIDSLVIAWNSGTREVYVHPEINTHHHFVEGASITHPFSLMASGSLLLCPGESIELNAGNYVSYLWNTGDTTQVITVAQSGLYFAQAWNEFGLMAPSDTIEVVVLTEAEVQFEVQHISCSGAQDGAVAVQISSGPVSEIFWNTGDTDTLITQLGPGIYSFSAMDSDGCAISGEVAVSEPSPLAVQALTNDALCYGEPSGSAQVNVIGGTPPYSTDWNGWDPEYLPAGDYNVMVSDENGCEFPVAFTIQQPDSLWLGFDLMPSSGESDGKAWASIEGGTPPYSLFWSTGDTDVWQLTNLLPGAYSLQVTDAQDCMAENGFVIDQVSTIQNVFEHDLQVFPNPSGGAVVLDGCVAASNIELYDIYGRLVYSQRALSCPALLSFSHLPAGQYVLRVQHGIHVESLRLVLSGSDKF